MLASRGYVFIFNESDRNPILLNRIGQYDFFTDTFNMGVLDLYRRIPKMCFLSFKPNEISHAALIRLGNRVATAKYAVKFSDFLELTPPINIGEVKDSTDLTFQPSINPLPNKEWQALVTFVKAKLPDSKERLEYLESLTSYQEDFSEDRYEIVAQEKDAVGLSLEIFGVDRKRELSASNIDKRAYLGTQPAPFLQGLVNAPVLEDAMINHDASVFGNEWVKDKSYQINATEFVNPKGEVLTIMNVNRNPVETALGVDLFYYHHRFHSYIMVQYKRMVKEGKKNEVVFRPDKQCYEEIKRMRNFVSQYSDTSQMLQCVDDYRLNPQIFFFKMCPAIVFDPLSPDLIPGMYLPLDYWDILEASPRIKSPQGSMKITNTNVDRYINNTLFIDLAQSGWLGSRLKTTDVLTQLIKQLLENGKSLILASSREPPRPKNTQSST